MLAIFRRSLNTWPVRLLFGLLVIAFGLWGVADMVRVVGSDRAVATVGGHRIEMPAVQAAYQRQLAQLTRMLAGRIDPTPEMRQSIADQAVEQLITQAAVADQVRRMHIELTDEALRRATYAMPAFQGPGGGFDRASFQSVLRQNGLDEGRYLDMMRGDLRQQQLLSAVRAGAVAPETMARAVFQYRQEKRVATVVEFPFAAAPAPPAPTEAQLRRYWQNHPDAYRTPELRHVKAVVLAPETLAKEIDISDQELQAAYEARKAEFDVPEKRSVQVLLSQDEAQAKALAEQWRGGGDWTQMEGAARLVGATSVWLDDSTPEQIPVPELSQAAFAAPADGVTEPFKTPLGWYVLKVVKVTPPAQRSLDQVRDELRRQLAEQKAADQIYDRAAKVQDALAAGGKLDELPTGLGLAAVTGTLDTAGNTAQGTPAPIPGSPELKTALVEAAFRATPNEAPRLTEVPGGSQPGQPQVSSYFALTVDAVTPPAVKPFEQVQDQVREAWTREAVRRTQEQQAAALYAAVKAGESLEDAALKAGLRTRRLPPAGREGGEGVPTQLATPLFGMKQGEGTMVETPDGFEVAQLAEIQIPDPKQDAGAFAQLRQELARGIGADVEMTLVSALRERAHPRVNREMLYTLAQP